MSPWSNSCHQAVALCLTSHVGYPSRETRIERQALRVSAIKRTLFAESVVNCRKMSDLRSVRSNGDSEWAVLRSFDISHLMSLCLRHPRNKTARIHAEV